MIALVLQHIADMDKLSQLAIILQAKSNLANFITDILVQANDFIVQGQYYNSIRLLYFSDLTIKGKYSSS